MSVPRRRFPGGRRARVVVGSALPIDVAERLPGCDVVSPAAGQGVMAQRDLDAAVADADALICLLQHRIDDGFLARAPHLGVVANNAVGYDNVDVPAASARGILVANTPDVLTDATADLAFALLLATARRLGEGEALLRQGRWHGFDPAQLLGAELSGRTLGLVGFGRIGRAVAARARGFGLRILYAAPRPAAAAVLSTSPSPGRLDRPLSPLRPPVSGCCWPTIMRPQTKRLTLLSPPSGMSRAP